MTSNFKRGQSRVWFGSQTNSHGGGGKDMFYDRYEAVYERLNLEAAKRNTATTATLEKIAGHNDRRQGSQISFKSHDSGFSDHHDSGVSTACSSTHNHSLASSPEDYDETDDSRVATPPTVIRRVTEERRSNTEHSFKGRRIQFEDEDHQETGNAKTSTPMQSPTKEMSNGPTDNDDHLHNSTFETFEGSSLLLSLPTYENPLLNDNPESVQFWFYEKRIEYDHEVLCTLQSKPIIAEAVKQRKPNTTVAINLIHYLQAQADGVQKLFRGIEHNLRHERELIVDNFVYFIDQVQSFSINLSLKQRHFFLRSAKEITVFQATVDSLLETINDFHACITGREWTRDVLIERVQMLKCYVVKILQTLYEKFVRIILRNLEQWEDESLICFAILTQLVELLKEEAKTKRGDDESSGFVSLTNCFLKTDIVKYLMIICINKVKYPKIQILALRALAMICDNTEAIYQFERADGAWIIKDMLVQSRRTDAVGFLKQEPITRETLSVLTQVTAPWHQLSHHIDGIRDNIEAFVECITGIVAQTNCCQTLLLSIAALNNLTMVEPTAVYSMMCHNTIFELKKKMESSQAGSSIFIHEQLTSMLNNVTKNRKCHHHLASKDFVNFLIGIFNREFYNKYETTAASTAHRATIKNIMHVLTRLMDDSSSSVHGRDLSVDNNIAAIIRSLQEQSFMNSSHSTSSSSFANTTIRSTSTTTTTTKSMAAPGPELEFRCGGFGETKSLSRQSSTGDVPKKPRINLASRKLSVNSSSPELYL